MLRPFNAPIGEGGGFGIPSPYGYGRSCLEMQGLTDRGHPKWQRPNLWHVAAALPESLKPRVRRVHQLDLGRLLRRMNTAKRGSCFPA